MLQSHIEIDELRIIAKNAFEKISLQEENARLRLEIGRLEGLGEIIGQSEAIKEVFDRIEKVGTTDVTVLIEGESGSGKELVAREIHKRSKRRNEPLIIMNCAAVPETLIESELLDMKRVHSRALQKDAQVNSSWPIRERYSLMKSGI